MLIKPLPVRPCVEKKNWLSAMFRVAVHFHHELHLQVCSHCILIFFLFYFGAVVIVVCVALINGLVKEEVSGINLYYQP